MRSHFVLVRKFAAAVFMLPALAGAFCGLQSCPRVNPRGAPHAFEAGVRTRVVAFDIGGEEGAYGVVSPRFFARAAGMSLGLEVPWVTLHAGAIDVSGFGNPLLMAQYARRFSAGWSAEAGAQWELPLGDKEHGLAGDHMMALPWVGLRKDWGHRWHAAGTLGYSKAFDGEEGHAASGSARTALLAKAAHNGIDHGAPDEAPLFVNPHGDEEVHARVLLGWMPNERWTFDGFGFGQADVSEADPVYYARAGVAAEWAVTPVVALQMAADVPVTSARRSEAALGVDVKIVW